MKKIAIISLYGNKNYGNKLQNYAVQQFFRGYGFDTVIVKTPYAYTKDVGNVGRRFVVSILNYLKHLKNVVFKINQIDCEKVMKERENNFRIFSQKYITETDVIVDRYNARRLIPDYDYYVVGSDQVWNSLYVGADPLYYLKFAEKKKRLSIAASFGHSIAINRYSDKMGKLLKEIRLITVRENTARTIVKELTGRECQVILDPTLLINEKEWVDIEEAPECFIPQKYVFTYFLGDVSEKRRAYIEKFARKHGVEIVALNDTRYKEYYSLNPAHFLYLIHRASYVITDSFHGTVFSIIYKKDFCVLKKAGCEEYMLDRITTLLNTFGLKQRLTDEDSIIESKTDYSGVNTVLYEERKKAQDLFCSVFREDERA